MSTPPAPASGSTRKAITHASVVSLAFPIMLSNASEPLVGISDTFVLGQLGQPGIIGGATFATIVLTFVFWLLSFLRLSTTAHIAQAYGRDDGAQQNLIFWRNMSAGLCIGLALLALQWPIKQLGFTLMHSDSQAVMETARAYFDVRIWSAPAVLVNYVLVGLMIARQQTGKVLVLQLLLNGTNISLNIVLGLQMGMGVVGVALASVVAAYLTLAVGLVLAFRQSVIQALPPRLRALVDGQYWRKALAAGADLALRVVILELAYAIFHRRMDGYGEVALDANAILMQLLLVSSFFLDGFVFATETYTGESIGAQDRRRLWRGIQLTSIWAGIASVVIAIAYLMFGPLLIAALSSAPAVVVAANATLIFIVLNSLVSIAAYQLDGIFIGAGATAPMRNQMLISFLVFVAALLGLESWLGLNGVWIAFLVFMGARGITLGLQLGPLVEAKIPKAGSSS